MPSRNVNGETFYFEEAGKGLPVVFLHGFPLDSRVWAKQRAGLADRARVITPDLRGFGKSPSNDPFSMASLAEDVQALLSDLGALPCILGGLSMGGYVALEFAKKYPGDLKGLMLIDTRADADSPEGKQNREKMIQLAREKGSPAVAEQMMPKMLAPGTTENRPAVAKELRAIMEACPALTIEHALAAMRDRTDHRSNLASIKTPTLIVVGDADAITPVASAEVMHKGIAGSRMEVIRGAGHMSPMEQPELVNRAVGEFIASIR